jgi:IS605 OrfB family transposase
MLKVVKVRIYPDTSQKVLLAKAFGSCRWLWNHFLNLINETYKATGKGLSSYDVKKLLPELKKQKDTAWLSETYSQCLQQVCINLGTAFNNFFEKRARYPNFKCKHGKQSLQYPANIKIENDCLKVPKIGLIYTKFHRSRSGKIKTITITKNCREDFLHKLSRRIVNENQVIAVENLNVKGMMQNHCLAKAIQQVGWGQFCTMLKYKAEQEGKVYIEVDRFFPSSKTCHVCLNKIGSLPLDVRYWSCLKCGTKHDRDLNAAINIRDEGLRIIQTSGTGDKAYCQTVSRSNRGRKKSTTTLVSG